MAQKIQPYSFRLGITFPWSARWFYKRSLRYFLEEDETIRAAIRKKILGAGIAAIDIERVGDTLRISVRAARPGLIIGRGGKGVEELRELLKKQINALRKKNAKKNLTSYVLNIEELKRTEVSAAVIAQQAAFEIEKRLPYRTVIKRQLELLKQNREVKGAKIRMGGRLNGAEISRTDKLAFGRMPLQTLRANIDYGEATSYNSYGTVGIKVWIYKGDIFKDSV